MSIRFLFLGFFIFFAGHISFVCKASESEKVADDICCKMEKFYKEKDREGIYQIYDMGRAKLYNVYGCNNADPEIVKIESYFKKLSTYLNAWSVR